ncbi:hypothetical protein MKQ68_10945 [Chitinophaga horti]|uniref:DUF3649 domain-containing protein n=1 Tax=Chitinophaga horti TaxID=2920382 RepID=A0ABY6J7F3_9BACT|nr:hypothetical protein [Chitinophaga horti]UYQ95618.1 hypothetical protein MKQ68_10945 [Chitinophaga horti]
MPANPKYLTPAGWQRFAKVSAATLGGLLVSCSFHLMWATWSHHRKSVLLTYSYTLFLMWCTLMLVAFLFHSGWKCWAWYGGAALLFAGCAGWGLYY